MTEQNDGLDWNTGRSRACYEHEIAALRAQRDELREVAENILARLDLEAEERRQEGLDGSFMCAGYREDLRRAIARAKGEGL